MTRVGRSPGGSGSRPTDEAEVFPSSSPKASIPSAYVAALMLSKDGPDGLKVACILQASYESTNDALGEGLRMAGKCYPDYRVDRQTTLTIPFPAIAIEARRAETPKSGSVHESAVPKGDAQ